MYKNCIACLYILYTWYIYIPWYIYISSLLLSYRCRAARVRSAWFGVRSSIPGMASILCSDGVRHAGSKSVTTAVVVITIAGPSADLTHLALQQVPFWGTTYLRFEYVVPQTGLRS